MIKKVKFDCDLLGNFKTIFLKNPSVFSEEDFWPETCKHCLGDNRPRPRVFEILVNCIGHLRASMWSKNIPGSRFRNRESVREKQNSKIGWWRPRCRRCHLINNQPPEPRRYRHSAAIRSEWKPLVSARPRLALDFFYFCKNVKLRWEYCCGSVGRSAAAGVRRGRSGGGRPGWMGWKGQRVRGRIQAPAAAAVARGRPRSSAAWRQRRSVSLSLLSLARQSEFSSPAASAAAASRRRRFWSD